jgi:hypothetical protein
MICTIIRTMWCVKHSTECSLTSNEALVYRN